MTSPVLEAQLGDDLLHLVHLDLRSRWELRRLQRPYVIGVRQIEEIKTWGGNVRR